MAIRQPTWLDCIIEQNNEFVGKIDPNFHPLKREPCPYAVITCMDPRINLEAVGIPPFSPIGTVQSQVRIIRTLGGMVDARSLVVGIHLAGFKEIALMMHTDCGCSLAYSRIDSLIENMILNLSEAQFQAFKNSVGEPFKEKLIDWLKAFEDPKKAVNKEILSLKVQPFIPHDLIVHGLVYDLSTGRIEVVVDGYD